MDELIDIGGTFFKIDLDALTDVLATKETSGEKHIETETVTVYQPDGAIQSCTVTSYEKDRVKEIDGPKYDTVRLCLEIIFTYNAEIDDTLGASKALESTTIPFKLAFNTLLSYGILKEVEQE